MEVVFLLVVFLILVVVLTFTKNLPIAIGSAAIAVMLLFQGTVFSGAPNPGAFDLLYTLQIIGRSVISRITVTTLLAFYTITFLQRMLEKRNRLRLAQESLGAIFNDRRLNAALSSIMVGMLPSPVVVTIAGAMVDASTGDSLTVEEKAFVSTYYRHVSEAFLPTYASILIGSELAGVKLSSFLIFMLPVVAVIITMGFVFYLRKVPKDTGKLPSKHRLREAGNILRNIWPLLLIVVLVIIFQVPIFIIVFVAVVLNIFVDRFSWKELVPLFRSAFEPKLLFTTVVIMIFKDFIIASQVIVTLPEIFSQLPLPSFLIYMMIIFFGSVIAGQQAINVVTLPMAFALGTEGIPLFVLLMTCGYCAMQVSPTHICLPIICDYFKVTMGSIVRKTLPVIICVMTFAALYYLLLRQLIT